MSEAPVCAGNIGPRERRKRVVIGSLSLVVALGLYVMLIALQVERIWRLPLFLPIWFWLLAWLEARGST
jgi:hypothetical protein